MTFAGNLSVRSESGTLAEPSQPDGWPDFARYRPYPAASTLSAWLATTHARTRSLFEVLDAERLTVPLSPLVNPPVWELGHLGWFQEFWMHRRGSFAVPSILPSADALYDSSRVPHDTRWGLELPDLDATWRYVDAVLEHSRELLDRGEVSDELAYFSALSVLHQDMHNEAFCYMWQTLGYPAPAGWSGGPTGDADSRSAERSPDLDAGRVVSAAPTDGDVDIPAGSFRLGAEPHTGFVFDNEKWAHEVAVPAFAIARHAVSNGQFVVFVEEDGYRRRDLWSDEGWRAVAESAKLTAPRYWRKEGGTWHARRFDCVVPLAVREPVMHVSLHEAQAYCRWAGRRLPTEAEWERAAATTPNGATRRRYPWGDDARPGAANLEGRSRGPAEVSAFPQGGSGWGLQQMLGGVWEWTASRFLPYPGFSADPYREYSAPWFADHHQVLRGGSFATPLRLIRNTWRNFYRPERADVFCGFRTCALQADHPIGSSRTRMKHSTTD